MSVAMALVVIQTLVMVAGLSLLGQLAIGAFNWNARHENVIYQLFAVVARPAVWVVRRITPRMVLDRHIPLATFLLLAVGYLTSIVVLRDVCLADLTQAGCERLAALRAGGGAP